MNISFPQWLIESGMMWIQVLACLPWLSPIGMGILPEMQSKGQLKVFKLIPN